jgi:hypothetical protein
MLCSMAIELSTTGLTNNYLYAFFNVFYTLFWKIYHENICVCELASQYLEPVGRAVSNGGEKEGEKREKVNKSCHFGAWPL